MSWLEVLFNRIGNLVRWWVTVAPWEEAIRVWLGKHKVKLGPGVHLRIPIGHVAYVQNTRYRVLDLPMQTITTKDGKTVTLSASVGYSIADIDLLYETLFHAEATVMQHAMGRIVRYVESHDLINLSPKHVERAVSGGLRLQRYGLAEACVIVTDWAVVRTYRVLTDQRYTADGSLDVNQAIAL